MASKAVFCLVMNPHDKLVMMIWDYDGKCMEMYFSGVKSSRSTIKLACQRMPFSDLWR